MIYIDIVDCMDQEIRNINNAVPHTMSNRTSSTLHEFLNVGSIEVKVITGW
jgi:hypothetical protein